MEKNNLKSLKSKEKIFHNSRTNFKKQVNIVSALLSIVNINETTRTKDYSDFSKHETDTINNEIIILKYRVERLEEEIKEQHGQTYSSTTGNKGLEIIVQNIAKSSTDIGDISIDVKKEIIVENVKPLLDIEINKLKTVVLENKTDNKEEILNICDEIISIKKPTYSWLKNKGQKLLDLCKAKSESLENISTILQIISTILNILNSSGQII